MIIGRQFVENQYEEKLYSTGDDELDEMLEKAFCEGYEYAQKEFARYKAPMSQKYVGRALKRINQELGTNYTKINQVAKDAYQGIKESGLRGEKLMKVTREGNRALHKGPQDAARLNPYSIKTLKLSK